MLRKYQKEDIEKGTKYLQTKKEKGLVLAHETGLGKTVISLKILQNYNQNEKIALIICPAFLKIKWAKEVNKWLPRSKRNFGIVIKSYNDVINKKILRSLLKYKYSLILLDEGHYLKTEDSQRSVVIWGMTGVFPGLISKCEKFLFITATPWPNRVGEIYPFLQAARHPLYKKYSYINFLKRFAKSVRPTVFGIKHRGIKNETELIKSLGPAIIRRDEKEVQKYLPVSTRESIPVKINLKDFDIIENPEERQIIKDIIEKDIKNDAHLEYYIDTLISTVPDFTKLSTFRKTIGQLKFKTVSKALKNYIDTGVRKFILFCYHKDVQKLYYDELKKTGVEIVIINGDIQHDKRFDLIEYANGLKECILLATMPSMAEGLDCIGFNRTFYAEIDWTPRLHNQTEGRTKRITQKHANIFWTYFNLSSGVEKYIYDSMSQKKKDIDTLWSVYEKLKELEKAA